MTTATASLYHISLLATFNAELYIYTRLFLFFLNKENIKLNRPGPHLLKEYLAKQEC